jgi:hypothetical protein
VMGDLDIGLCHLTAAYMHACEHVRKASVARHIFKRFDWIESYIDRASRWMVGSQGWSSANACVPMHVKCA